MHRSFFGKWIIAAAFLTFGIAVGLPYYNMPFFYDYYVKTFHWPLHDITLGFPLAALLTLWVGPVLVPRFSQRKLIVAGTALTFISFFGFSHMTGDLTTYYFLWFIYTFGYIISGPIPHQIIVSHWYRRNRGMAMGIRLRRCRAGRRVRPHVADSARNPPIWFPHGATDDWLRHVPCVADRSVRA